MTAERTNVNVAIIGTGTIGGELLNQIKEFNVKASKNGTPSFNVVAITSTRGYCVSKDYKPIDLTQWRSLHAQNQGALSVDILLDFLSSSPLPAIMIDNTSSELVASSYPKFLAKNISIATPNKKGFSADADVYNSLVEASKTSNAHLMHEASVGAGLPIISTLKELIATGDEILKVEGIFSGTLSYIFNVWSPNGKKSTASFSDIVKVAKENGYTEPDPRDDLNGMDVARKVTILSRLAGVQVDSPSSFPVKSLIPKPLESAVNADEFMAGLPNYDAEFAKIRDEAEKEGKVVRFVGEADVVNKSTLVKLEKYDASHPFANLQSSDNIIAFTTKRYQARPLVIIGAGAGPAVTAAGVLGDMIKIMSQVRAHDAPSA
ncbi:homoserine dehydrogenase Hom6 [Schizosaccharomyces osmophilus]|uniref:Homoserine dehydrogenase n=1 Tax=Schizosaccharomyces osmophilus TaxID=2545709 RepID=A0AAE9WD18_9SCHI|nr:homoserine dehydrogenase Hom6 [Schizosaccharomyces osmophilus]WBW72443.1 homoserine dehydrogenase Hom6 [Schizosaccharomyces osmophilus]